MTSVWRIASLRERLSVELAETSEELHPLWIPSTLFLPPCSFHRTEGEIMPRLVAKLLVLLVASYLVPLASAAEPLHVRIDKIVDATQIGPQAAIASDAKFLRRIYLDLTGSIPSAAETREFLDDKAADKRTKLIDRLLAGPQYPRHMTTAFSVMLMERRTDAGDWLEFLRTSFEQNKPWNQMAAEIFGSDGVDAAKRGPANYFFARNAETNLMTRDVGRMFFGMDLQCAQCHDHPLIDDYSS